MNCLANTPCPEDCTQVDIPKDIITETFNKAEQNTSPKILIRFVLGNYNLGGGD